MPRNMSFILTTDQVRNRTKTITRRFGWWFLKPGDLVQPVVKSRGMKRGEKIKRIGEPIRIVGTRSEQLKHISLDDVIREGFPDWTPEQFIDFFCQHAHCGSDAIVNVIEFEYTSSEDGGH